MKEKILLRTMTLKSVFNQGKYINKTVNDVFVNDISYLSYVYYNIEKLTFTPEVLKAIGIPKVLQFKSRVSTGSYIKNTGFFLIKKYAQKMQHAEPRCPSLPL